ncbi:energy transducer TonB [Salinimicrobium sp. MT39]|uniref:Energy transducer TonB n=1 Tax=Salinimicrobium profundisediminis TaxID=2994553 RepID=A0A9X3CV27_9FLAO|nr:energy transducer TonB [Salinimicrobium profundisediminis]MCX2837194.1 energy transducer TonB [Salinimicrobium profundisediminis]
MKYLYLFLFLFFFSNNSFSQDAYLLPAVDTAPVIGTCDDSKDTKDCFNAKLNDHIQANLDIRKTLHATGKAYVQFKVSADGQVQDVKVRAEDSKHRKEAKRVIKMLKIKEPATLNGEKVAVLHSLPITFRTVNHNSMEEYLSSEDFQKNIEKSLGRQETERLGVIKFEELKFPPEYQECVSMPDNKECFRKMTNEKLRAHLQKEIPKIKSGTEIKYFFEVNKQGKTLNVIAIASGKRMTQIVKDALENLKFESPAKDEQGNPVKTEFAGSLIF